MIDVTSIIVIKVQKQVSSQQSIENEDKVSKMVRIYLIIHISIPK